MVHGFGSVSEDIEQHFHKICENVGLLHVSHYHSEWLCVYSNDSRLLYSHTHRTHNSWKFIPKLKQNNGVSSAKHIITHSICISVVKTSDKFVVLLIDPSSTFKSVHFPFMYLGMSHFRFTSSGSGNLRSYVGIRKKPCTHGKYIYSLNETYIPHLPNTKF